MAKYIYIAHVPVDNIIHSFSVTSANIAINDIIARNYRFFGLHFCRLYSTTLTHWAPNLSHLAKSRKIRAITSLEPSRSFKIIDFGTNRKPCDFLLVINTNLHSISHRLKDIAADYCPNVRFTSSW